MCPGLTISKPTPPPLRRKARPQAEPGPARRPLMSPAAVAADLGLDQVTSDPIRTVHDMRKRGELVGVKVGKFWLITPESVDKVRTGQ